MFVAITKELSKTNYNIENSIVLDVSNKEETISVLQQALQKTNAITLYDRTKNTTIKENTLLHVNDHINKSGLNPLIGKQRELKIDFVDMSYVYVKSKNGIITESLGHKFFINAKYPSHYMAPLIILAKAIGFKTIKGFLINKLQ